MQGENDLLKVLVEIYNMVKRLPSCWWGVVLGRVLRLDGGRT